MQTVLEGAATAPEALRAQSAMWNDQQARMRERDEELPVMHLTRNEEDIEAARRRRFVWCGVLLKGKEEQTPRVFGGF